MTTVLNFLKSKGFWGAILFVVFMFAGSAYFLQKRLFEEKASELQSLKKTVTKVAEVQGITLEFISDTGGGILRFGSAGPTYPREGHGMAIVTEVNEAMLKLQDELKFAVKGDDYPVVIQFNSSGFDLSGEPVSVRRLKDGSVIYQSETMLRLTRFAAMMQDGTYVVTFYDDQQSVLNEKQWVDLVLRGTIVDPKAEPKKEEPKKEEQFPRPRVLERKD